jgi:hypothetical protein
MSGIFKGDSIYKSGGGGGGGFKDGGQLVDGDFIKVENNTVSSYDNVSRDPVNFYFEVKDGEILNSVVELTTAVNATINVYYVKNGLYYLLGNVGGNTVNAGDDYKLNVVGNSFMLEVVTPTQAVPEYADFKGNVISVVGYGDYLISEDLGQWFYFEDLKEIVSGSSWDIVNKGVIESIKNGLGLDAMRSTSGWNNTQGTNSSGLNFYPYGKIQAGNYHDVGENSECWCYGTGSGNTMKMFYNSISYTTNGTNVQLRGRIMKKYKNI